MLKKIKELIKKFNDVVMDNPPKQEYSKVEIGDTYIAFNEAQVEVLDVKNGYVTYRSITGEPMEDSITVDTFNMAFRKKGRCC